MRKMLITLALVAAPILAAAQQPSQTPDSSKAKPKTAPAHQKAKPKAKAAADTSKAKPKEAAPATTDTTKKPN
jgi:hypothetical protein